MEIQNHQLCMMLLLKYMDKLALEAPDNLRPEFSKYQTSPTVLPGEAVGGRAWIRWFLNDYVPQKLKEEDEPER